MGMVAGQSAQAGGSLAARAHIRIACALHTPLGAESTGSLLDTLNQIRLASVERDVRSELFGECESALAEIHDDNVGDLRLNGSEKCAHADCS